MLLVQTRVDRSPIHGLGLFAAEPIARGTEVWRFTPGWDLDVPREQLAQLPEAQRERLLHYGYVDARLGRYILCCDDMRFANHSDAPNLRGDYARDRYGVDVAVRDIAAGEELTTDYGILEGAPPAGEPEPSRLPVQVAEPPNANKALPRPHPAMIALTHEPIDTADLLRRVASPQAGAVVLFLGTTRAQTGGRATASLDYECYPDMAHRKLAELETAARGRWPLVECAIVHRLGHLPLGEASVAVAVSAAHREEAFAAGKWLIDTLKETVPIWKRENWADGTSQWVHPGLESPGDRPETAADRKSPPDRI